MSNPHYMNGVFYDGRIAIGDNFALTLGGKIVAFGQIRHLNDGDFDGIYCGVRQEGEKKLKEVRSNLSKKAENKAFLKELRGLEFHETGLPEKGEEVAIPVWMITDIEDGLKKANSLPDISQADLLECNIQLTAAAKIVEKAIGDKPLTRWLKFVNRKAIALINKEK